MKTVKILLASLALAASTASGAADLLIRGATVHTLTEAGVLDNSDLLRLNIREQQAARAAVLMYRLSLN